MREFLSIKRKLRIESRVDTQPIWQKRKTCKKRESEFTRNFLNFHSLKKTEKFRKKSREIMRWSDQHRRASFILIFLSHSPRYYLCSYFSSLCLLCFAYLILFFVLYLFLDITYFDIRLLPRDSDGTIIFPQIPKSRGIFVLFFCLI